MSRIIDTGKGLLGFHRLAIMGLDESGNAAVCVLGVIMSSAMAGISGFRKLKKELEEKGYKFVSDSDCELLLPLYKEYGTDMFGMLDAEYALNYLRCKSR